MQRLRFVGLIVAILLAIGNVPDGHAAQKKLTVGVLGAMSGPAASWGLSLECLRLR